MQFDHTLNTYADYAANPDLSTPIMFALIGTARFVGLMIRVVATGSSVNNDEDALSGAISEVLPDGVRVSGDLACRWFK